METLFPGSTELNLSFAMDIRELEPQIAHNVDDIQVTPYVVKHASGALPFAYRIEVDGQGRKVGVSSLPPNSAGDYSRPRAQVRELEDIYREDTLVDYRVRRTFPDRASALDYETRFLDRFKRFLHRVAPGN